MDFALPAPGLTPSDIASAKTAARLAAGNKAKAKSTAENFEAVFLNSMFQQMFTEVGGDGPFGGKGATGIWRSMLTDEYSKSFAKAGGIGIASQVYSALMAQQEMRP